MSAAAARAEQIRKAVSDAFYWVVSDTVESNGRGSVNDEKWSFTVETETGRFVIEVREEP